MESIGLIGIWACVFSFAMGMALCEVFTTIMNRPTKVFQPISTRTPRTVFIAFTVQSQKQRRGYAD